MYANKGNKQWRRQVKIYLADKLGLEINISPEEEDRAIRNTASSQFLKGYADSDLIYDNN